MSPTRRPIAPNLTIAAALRTAAGLLVALVVGSIPGPPATLRGDAPSHRPPRSVAPAPAPAASPSAPSTSSSTSPSTEDAGAKFLPDTKRTEADDRRAAGNGGGPPLELVLSTGERLAVFDVVGTPDGLAIREPFGSGLRGEGPEGDRRPIRIPWSAVDSLGPPAGLRFVARGRFEQGDDAANRPSDPQASDPRGPGGADRAGEWRTADPSVAGQVRIALIPTTGDAAPDTRAPSRELAACRLLFEFADLAASDANVANDANAAPGTDRGRTTRAPVSVVAERDAQGIWRTLAAAELHAARQALGPRPSARELLLEWRAGRWTLRLDELVLAWGHTDGRGLVALLDESPRATRPQGKEDDAHSRRAWTILAPDRTEAPSARTDPKQDAVRTNDGDELFGELAAATSEGIDLVTAGERLRIDWTRIRAVRPARRIVASRALRGTWSTFDCGPEAVGPFAAGTVLEGIAERGADGAWRLEHPWLGRCDLPRDAVVRRATGFVGTRLVLADHAVRLGARRRDDLRCALPIGSEAEGAFELESVPAGRPRLVLDVADVAPSGPAAPPGTPHLADLRAGFGTTRLRINDRDLGDVNSRLSWERSPFGPQRVIVPLAPSDLRPGRNTWSLRQSAGRAARDAYDDCEIGPVRLEFVESETAGASPEASAPPK